MRSLLRNLLFLNRYAFKKTCCLGIAPCNNKEILNFNIGDQPKISRNYGLDGLNCRFYSLEIKKSGYGSKFHPPSYIEVTETKLRQIFFEKIHFTPDEWEILKNQLFSEILILNSANFDSIFMSVLLGTNNFTLANSFMLYLKKMKLKPNYVTCLKYMSLCARNIEKCHEDEILSIFDKIKNIVDSAPVLDGVSVDCIVQGLCGTSKWRESLKYIEKLHMSKPFLDTKTSLVCAALRNNEESEAWEMLTTFFRPNELPHQRVFRTYMKYITKISLSNLKEADLLLAKLLNYLKQKEVTVKSELAKDLERYFNSHPLQFDVKLSKVNRLGQCLKCKEKLESSKLTEEEFEHLKKTFFEEVLKKSDVFINTTNDELQKFIQFINQRKPFDIVLDGLNAAHRQDAMGGEFRRTLASQLLDVVKQISITKHRILVLGRLHMRSWPRRIMDQIYKKCDIFFASNVSEDDPFVLYATLASGPRTLFVSSDLMRDHLARLDGDVSVLRLFKRWQQSHQIFLQHKDGPVFDGPLKHCICIQGNMEDGWHIPYDDEFILDPYEELNNWLCIQKRH